MKTFENFGTKVKKVGKTVWTGVKKHKVAVTVGTLFVGGTIYLLKCSKGKPAYGYEFDLPIDYAKRFSDFGIETVKGIDEQVFTSLAPSIEEDILYADEAVIDELFDFGNIRKMVNVKISTIKE